MKNKLRIVVMPIVLFAFIATANAFIPLHTSSEWKMSLNGSWRFKLNGPANIFYKQGFDDSLWDLIAVPSNWEIAGFEAPRYEKPNECDGLYRRDFTLPPIWNDRRVFIRFEGILFAYELWVNGKRAGNFESPFNRHDFDVTDLLKSNKINTLAVRVYRRYKGWEFDTFDDWALSGIFRDVFLYAVSDAHIHDCTFNTDIAPGLKSALLNCKIEISQFSGNPQPKAEINGLLVSPNGSLAGQFSRSLILPPAGRQTILDTIHVANPLLWNAETPNLYLLQLELKINGVVQHTCQQKIGFRKITIANGVLLLNYSPIKIRGVNHHDMHPDVGRAMRANHYRQDIELMKSGNINAVRMSHYPPNPVFLDLCDQYGLYVIDEVPFGFGEIHLKDSTYQEILLNRAEATVARDKNHPSVLIWSIGNENPVTPLVTKTAQFVRDLDPGRPRLLPGAGFSGSSYNVQLPDCIDIVAPHYPYAHAFPERKRWGLDEAATSLQEKRPILTTEYNHAMDGTFEGLEEIWEVIEQYDRLAGGCIWHFQDQGIKRKIDGRQVLTSNHERYGVNEEKDWLCADAWLDKNTILDSHGQAGTDGILYADRFPQADYWTTRAVYSQILIPEMEIRVKSGKQIINLSVLNRYDFTNLNQVKGHWELSQDCKRSKSREIRLEVAPREKLPFSIEINLPVDYYRRENLLHFAFTDFNSRRIYEHTIRLLPANGKVSYASRLEAIPTRNFKEQIKGTHLQWLAKDLMMEAELSTGEITIRLPGVEKPFLTGPCIRAGREPEMSEMRNYPRYKLKYWDNYLLFKGKVLENKILSDDKKHTCISSIIEYPRTDKGREGQSIRAELKLTFSHSGWIDVDYTLVPQKVNGCFLELGLGFQLPEEMTHLTWLGDGPFASYPGQSAGAIRGIYHIETKARMDSLNRNFDGNRAKVDLAVISDIAGNGIGVLCNSASISLQKIESGMLFSHLLKVAGKGNKTGGMLTRQPIDAEVVGSVSGSLRIIPLKAGHWPELFRTILLPILKK